jgi:hypothetical protein
VSGLPPQPRRSIADTVTSGASAKINESKVLWSAMDPGTVTSPGPRPSIQTAMLAPSSVRTTVGVPVVPDWYGQLPRSVRSLLDGAAMTGAGTSMTGEFRTI